MRRKGQYIMKLKGSFLALIITIFVALSLSFTVFADPISGTCGTSNVTYEIGEDQTLTISGSGEMPDYSTNDAPWAEHSSSILKIVISDGVTSIGNNAFLNVHADEVTIPNSVTSIGEYALGYLYIEGNYTRINEFTIIAASGSAAETYANDNDIEFRSTDQQTLKGECGDGVYYELTPDGVLTISGNGEMNSFASEKAPWYKYVSGDRDYVIREVRILDGVTNVGENAFYGCTSLAAVTLSQSVTDIASRAFEDCAKLSSVTMENSVISIGDEAFAYCTALKYITLSDTLQSLGKRAFYQSGLTEITLPASLTVAGETVFYGCASLTDATVNCVTVPPRVFAECTSLKTVTLTDTVQNIGEYAFGGCTSLSSVTSSSNLVSVREYAFQDCAALTEVNFESSVTEYGIYCFKNCVSLKKFTFADQIEIIPEGMFFGCTSLSEVTLGDNINSILNYAFVDCNELASLFVSYKVRNIGQYAYGYSYSDGNYLPISDAEAKIEGFTPSVAQLYAEANGITFVSYKTVDTDLGNITDDIVWKFRPSTGVLNIIGEGEMPDYLSFAETPWYVYKTYIKQVTFSNGILNIGSNSFNGCSTIETIDIPASAQTIGASAFAGTSIVTANIPSGIIRIENNAFDGCASLYTVSLPNTLQYIGEAAFRGSNIMTSILIPESVVEIGAKAIGFDADNSRIADFKVKGVEGTLASIYAEHNGLSFIINGYVEILDSVNDCKVSILGDSANGYKLEFNKLSPIFTPMLIIPSDQTLIQYEIVLKYNDENADFDGSAEISFPIPEGMADKVLYVYSVADNGDFIAVNFSDTGSKISFSNTELGKYVISTVDLSNLYKITVNYLYSNGSSVTEPLYVRATSGAEYRFTAEKKKGCTIKENTFSGTVADSDVTIDFIYVKKAGSNSGGKDSTVAKIVITVFLIILILALIAAVILLIYLNKKKKNQEKETGKTIKAAAKKPDKQDEMAKTMIVPDFATREINIESLFADDPEEDLDAEEKLKKK